MTATSQHTPRSAMLARNTLAKLAAMDGASEAILQREASMRAAEGAGQESPSAPAHPEKLNVADVIHLTGRLTQLLKEEIVLLEQMKIQKVAELQQEKQFLTTALEGHRRLLAKHPQLRDGIAAQERSELESVVHIFEDILAENHRRLLIAREANHRIVQTITKVARQAASGSVYDDSGVRGMMGGEPLSFTLNQTA